jgi:cellulose synthase/poly-beta-1,6-N-acetylglucosamine synthase-like glycosyltransferase
VLEVLFVPAVVLYLAILVLLFAFGLNFIHLTIVALRTRGRTPDAVEPADWPHVTVQLPIYNELYVARRLIEAVAAFDYPRDRLEIQVLDDSTDETAGMVGELVGRLRADGIDIHHVRRAERRGFKAGALGHGLTLARGELLAIFDADFVPRPDYLRRTVPVLAADPGLAFVQARWDHTNRGFSLLTRLQALSIDGHFAVEQAGRWASGQWFNFNGTAGVWRRTALDGAGGWLDDTLTEDLDLSYRAHLAGWRGAYVGGVTAPAELPVSFNAYRRQQHRWARGSFECAFKHLPAIWRAPIPVRRRVQATLHLAGYSIHLLLLALSLLYPVLLGTSSRYPEVFSLFGVMALFNLTSLAPTVMFTVGQRQLGRRWIAEIPTILALSGLGAGMMVNTARAAWQALAGRPGVFERTPKFGVRHRREDWRRLRYQLGIDRIVVVEIALAALNAASCIAAIGQGSLAIAVYTAIFTVGLSSAVALTIGQTVATAVAVRRSPLDAPEVSLSGEA